MQTSIIQVGKKCGAMHTSTLFFYGLTARPIPGKQERLPQSNPNRIVSQDSAQSDMLSLRSQKIRPRFASREFDPMLNTPGTDELTALERACKNKKAYRILSLVAYGADIERRNGEGATPLLQVVSKEKLKLGDLGVIEMLLRVGANVNAADKTGRTPITEAEKRHPVIAKLLRENVKLPPNLQKIQDMARDTVLKKKFYAVGDPKIKRHKADIRVSFIYGYFLKKYCPAGFWYEEQKKEIKYGDALRDWWNKTTNPKRAELSFFEKELYRYRDFTS